MLLDESPAAASDSKLHGEEQLCTPDHVYDTINPTYEMIAKEPQNLLKMMNNEAYVECVQ